MAIPKPPTKADLPPALSAKPSMGTPIDVLAGLGDRSGLNIGVAWDGGAGNIDVVTVTRPNAGKMPEDLVALRGLDLTTGAVSWTIDPAQFGLTEPALAEAIASPDQSVVALVIMDWANPTANDLIVSLDPSTGTLGTSIGHIDRNASVVVVGGMVVVVDDTHVSAYRPSDLTTPVWQRPSSTDIRQFYSINRGVIGGAWVYTGDGFVTAADGTPTGLGTEPVTCAYYQQASDGSLFRVVPNAADQEFDVWAWDAASTRSPWQAPLEAETTDIAVQGDQVFLVRAGGGAPFTVTAASLATGQQTWASPVAAGSQTPCQFACGGVSIAQTTSSWVLGTHLSMTSDTEDAFAVHITDGSVVPLGNTHGFIAAGGGVIYSDGGGALSARSDDAQFTQLWSLPLVAKQEPYVFAGHLVILDGAAGTVTLLS